MDTEYSKHFRVKEREKFSSIQIFKDNSAIVAAPLRKYFNTVMGDPKNIVICCAGLSAMEPSIIDTILAANDELQVKGKSLSFIHCGAELAKFILQRSKKVKIYPTLYEATIGAGSSAAPGNILFIKAFVVSAVRAMLMQAHIEFKQEKISFAANNGQFPNDISGVIIVESEKYTYLVMISFPEETYLTIISKMLGQTYTQLTDDIVDGATELLNIIFGQAKSVLNLKEAKIRPSIPILFKHKIIAETTDPKRALIKKFMETSKTVVVPFSSAEGPFTIAVAFSPDFELKELRGS